MVHHLDQVVHLGLDTSEEGRQEHHRDQVLASLEVDHLDTVDRNLGSLADLGSPVVLAVHVGPNIRNNKDPVVPNNLAVQVVALVDNPRAVSLGTRPAASVAPYIQVEDHLVCFHQVQAMQARAARLVLEDHEVQAP